MILAPDRYSRVIELFEDALAQGPDAREPFLARACENDGALLREVHAMLAADVHCAWFLEKLPDDLAIALLTSREPRVGQRLSGRYELLEKIGAGGMGIVFRAHDDNLDRDIALKILPLGALSDRATRNRFRNEALALSRLNHPNIATVHDFDTDGEVDFLVLEYLPGIGLDRKIAEGSLSSQEFLQFGTQLLKGLEAAHEIGVVHCDLKPSNLQITLDGRLKILDFGIARFSRSQMQNEFEAIETTAQHQGAIGTLPYMAPEQFQADRVDARTDVYAAAAVLYEMATGQPVFRDTHDKDLTDAILHRVPLPPSSLSTRVPLDLDCLLLKALDKNPDRRHQTARELHADIERVGREVIHGDRSRLRRMGADLTISAFAVSLAIVTLVFATEPADWLRNRLFIKDKTAEIRTVAVLPLKNGSGDRAQEYLADGITETLIAELGKIGALRVISQNSVMPYKHSYKQASEIGRELQADALLQGTVARFQNRLRITATLVGTTTQRVLWHKSFESDVRYITDLERRLGRSIVAETKVKIDDRAFGEAPRQFRPAIALALDLYLRGLTKLRIASDKNGLLEAIGYFNRAVVVDPQYAPGYAGLAEGYARLGFRRLAPVDEVKPKAEQAVRRSLEIDPGLPQAYLVAGQMAVEFDWNPSEGERLLRKAIELEPGNSEFHRSFAQYVSMYAGRADEALRHFSQAESLDPLNVYLSTEVGRCYYQFRRYSKAIAKLQSAIKRAPEFDDAHFFLGLAYLESKQYQPAVAELQKAVTLANRAPAELAYLANAVGRSGDHNRATVLHAELTALAKKIYVPEHFLAISLLGLGRSHEAIELLRKALVNQTISGKFADAPIYDSIRDDPEFVALARQFPVGKARSN